MDRVEWSERYLFEHTQRCVEEPTMRPFVARYPWAVVLMGVTAVAAPGASGDMPTHASLTAVRFPSVGFDPTSQEVRVTVVNPCADVSWAVVIFYAATGHPLKRESLTVGARQTAFVDLTCDDFCGVTG